MKSQAPLIPSVALASIIAISILGCGKPAEPKLDQSSSIDSIRVVNDSLRGFSIIQSVKNRVVVEKLPSYNVVSITYKGSYVQHPDAFGKLQEYVFANYAAVGNCIGFYPFDPDAVQEDKLTWDIALRVVPGAATNKHEMLDSKSADNPFSVNASIEQMNVPLQKLPQPKSPFKLQTIPSTLALSLTTTVADAGKEGLALKTLIDMLGYVQTGVTRTEYAMENRNPLSIRVKISVPVAARKSGLRLL